MTPSVEAVIALGSIMMALGGYGLLRLKSRRIDRLRAELGSR